MSQSQNPSTDPAGATGGQPPGPTGATGGQSDQQQNNGQQNNGATGNADTGFPANTPLAQMTDAQKAAYYKHQNRLTDEKLQAFNGFTPEDVSKLWTQAHTLESERLTADQRALQDATEQAAAQARAAVEAELRPKLLASQLRAVATPAFSGDETKLTTWLEGIDPARFVGEDGDIDAAKVTNHLSAIVGPPQTGNQFRQWGQHSGPPPTTQPGEGGRAEAERRKERRVYT